MTYTKKEGDSTKTYEVSYDKEQLKESLNKIVRECSYKVKGKFEHECGEIIYERSTYRIIKGPQLPNGDFIYQDITRIYDDFDGMCSCIDTVEGSMVIVPELANIVVRLIKEDSSAIDSLLDYENSDEFVSIESKIELKVNEIHKKSSTAERDVDKLIELSEELKQLRNKQNNNQYFNLVLLGMYYFMVKDSINYQLVSNKKEQALVRSAPQFSKR